MSLYQNRYLSDLQIKQLINFICFPTMPRKTIFRINKSWPHERKTEDIQSNK